MRSTKGRERLRRREASCRALAALVAILFGVAPAPVSALVDGGQLAANGNGHGAPACSACHGAHGEGGSADGFPRLAGLSAGYLEAQLADFADGKRDNAIMQPFAKALAPDERTAVAEYYASLRVEAAAEQKPVDPKLVAAGARLADHPTWSKGLPACNQCHGPRGIGVGAAFPRLAGQSSAYIENQFKAWQHGTRSNDPLRLMAGIATKLDSKDIDAVAAYYASLSGEPASGPTNKASP